jgi:hypothetical protein
MPRKRSTQRTGRAGNAQTRALLIITAVNGPRILVGIPDAWHWRMLTATLHKLAAELEAGSEGQRWCVYTDRHSDRHGVVRLELCEGDSVESAMYLLNAVAADYRNGKI